MQLYPILPHQDAVSDKKKDLLGQLHYHKLIKDINELEIWMTEMLQVAYDECYKDTSNLKGKKKQHIALLEEIEIKKVGRWNVIIMKTYLDPQIWLASLLAADFYRN